jgi:hypothetical protein
MLLQVSSNNIFCGDPRVRNGKTDTRKTCRYQKGNENMLFDERPNTMTKEKDRQYNDQRKRQTIQ